eukprot:XP_017949735.1 PREDICTED: eukaryotic translation initiation factor 2-alpha kinase 3 [Xenopus tropicalis]
MFCAKRNLHYEFKLISKTEPPNDPWFTVHLYIENEIFGEGQGRSRKAADKEAARTGLAALQNRGKPSQARQPSAADSWDPVPSSGSNSTSNSSQSLGSDATEGSSERSSSHTTQSTVPTTNVEQSPLREFENVTELSSGGFGIVYKAWKPMDLNYYAVKKVKMYNEKCKSEVQALARLDHPNIVRYFNSWTGMDYFLDTSSLSSSSSRTREDCSSDTRNSSSDTDGRNEYLYIQMEFCENGDLRNWIREMKEVDKKNSLDIFWQIVKGVAYIHSQKLIHRDLKPENIFFSKDKKVKIGDFGLVTQIFSEGSTKALLRTHGTGTYPYMAPEQQHKKTNYNSEVDIFALGLILVELLCIFGTEHERRDELMKIRNCQFPKAFVAKYPCEISTIRLMLSRDPKNRPAAIKLKAFLEWEPRTW